ncbi:MULTISPECIES: dihydroorotase family protein [Cytobacillus]|uniref:Allantoinase n=2 Tax=Cytobacillus TaxID=2675230 RepID=A0ABX3CM11_9BACI|nr:MULTISPECIES: dihydroorotase [Cytobacillus]MCM3245779.1 dihydroorotase [Cytobacillus oceanisediminis]MCM3404543.1 dihydroorotase [Cytobacillus oceanisediminis]MDK7668041.1 dihydroorotase [Cytobacillus oceanisediminis]OHX43798.1 allantoinase [Cytobacillus oceanisediminis]QOK28429.1 dihydroorotase [Cytobacillus oceanisediminis]
MDLILKNASIPQGDRQVLTNILVNEGKIVGYTNDISFLNAARVIDIKRKLVVPGCIDPHTHFMDPGFTHRETFATGSRSAAAGGLTTIIDMPCCSKPSVRDGESFNKKIGPIRDQAYIDYCFWGGMTGEDAREGWIDNIYPQIDQGVVAFKVYMTPSVPTFPKVSDAEMLEIFRNVAKTGLPIGVHAENYDICTFYSKKLEKEGRLDGPAWAEARSSLAEKVAIELILSFAEATDARVHVVHMSTKEGVELVKAAKKRGVKVTAETCPHYLVLNAKDSMSERGSYAKIAPPLRGKEDNESHWQALADGTIDFVGTDHAPYEIATEKDYPGATIWNTFPGIPGVETMVPILVSEGLNKGRLSLSRFVEVTSRNAAIHYGIYPKKGSMEIGSDADFTVIDLEKEYVIDEQKTESMAKYNPLHGMKLKGKPVQTIIRGTVIFDEDKGIVGEAGYGEYVPRQSIQRLERTFKYEKYEAVKAKTKDPVAQQ